MKITDFTSTEQLSLITKPVICSKQYGLEHLLTPLIVEAVSSLIKQNEKNPKAFNVDSVRTVKILGGCIQDSEVISGMVFGREPDSVLKSAKKAKVAVFNCPIDKSRTETKGTVLLHDAKELLDFGQGEEKQMEMVFSKVLIHCIQILSKFVKSLKVVSRY